MVEARGYPVLPQPPAAPACSSGGPRTGTARPAWEDAGTPSKRKSESRVVIRAPSGRSQVVMQMAMVRATRFGIISAVVLLASAGWLFARWQMMVSGENQVSREAFASLAGSIKNTIKSKVEKDMIYQDMVADIWCTFPNITRADFRKLIISEAYRGGLLTMTGISLIPRVVGPVERARLEADAGSELFRQDCCRGAPNAGASCAKVAAAGLFCTGPQARYQITEFGNTTAVFVPAVGNSSAYMARVGQEEYMVVHMIEPFESNTRVWGYNLLSSPPRAAAWKNAKASGKKAMTRRIILVQSTQNQYGFLVWLPIFATPSGTWTTSMDGNLANLTAVGSVNGVYQAQQLLTGAIQSTYSADQLSNVAIYLFDNAAELNGDAQYLAAYGSVNANPYSAYGAFSVNDIRSMPHVQISHTFDLEIENSDARWLVVIQANDVYLSQRRTNNPEICLVIGLVMLVVSTIDRWLGHPRLMLTLQKMATNGRNKQGHEDVDGDLHNQLASPTSVASTDTRGPVFLVSSESSVSRG